jgi:large subunit ribosomal protein L21
MSYAIISVGGKQYRVREGERLLVDRLSLEDGATFTPSVLLTGGDGDASLAPGVVVTAKVVRQAKGPKLVIGKYKKRTGYKRHTGFRASLTQIEIESIGGASRRGSKQGSAATSAPEPRAPEPKAAEATEADAKAREAATPGAPPAGYGDLTVAEVKRATAGWDTAELAAALAYEQSHAKRKGAIAALESAISEAE